MSNRRRNQKDDDFDEEAIEENLNLTDEDPVVNSDEEGEDLNENLEKDYEVVDNLDEYDYDDLDEKSYSNISFEAKRKADQEIEKREKLSRQRAVQNQGSNRHRPKAMNDEYDNSILSDGTDFSRELRNKRETYFEEMLNDDDLEEDDELDQKFSNIEEIRGKLTDWITDSKTVRYIQRSFKTFLVKFRENNNLVYEQKISEMCSNNAQSLEVTYSHLTSFNSTLAYWVFENPLLIIKEINKVAYNLAIRFSTGYRSIRSESYVKIGGFPLDEKIRDLRTNHLNTLLKVRGVISKRYPVYSQMKEVTLICRCGEIRGPIFESDFSKPNLSNCPSCGFRGPYKIFQEKTLYKNFQKVIIQESPSSVPPGRMPRSKEVELLGDNIDYAKPGDEVEITGIYISRFDYHMNKKHGFPIFSTTIQANNVRKVNEIALEEITADEKEQILKLSKDPKIFEIITGAIAPSIYGHQNIKVSLSLAIFGGTPVEQPSHRVRGDINILLVGDPGLAKSQFLKYVQSISPRCVYTTGKGASAVGLTASVQKDPISNEWCLEGGALVLADQGICLIDEFDKMSEVDRTSIHEAMEQQTISISKAGIVATLSARCSVIAAANPIRGTYDNQISFQDNVNLSDPILSRFDIMCVLKDEIDFVQDSAVSKFIISSHINSHPETKRENEPKIEDNNEQKKLDSNNINEFLAQENLINGSLISQELLKKYIIYAKKNYRPMLTYKCSEKLKKFYVKLRQLSQSISGINIVARHLESLIRFATSSAKIHLRTETNDKDTNIAINCLLSSFLNSVSSSHRKNIEKKFSSELNLNRNSNSMLQFLLNKMLKDQVNYLSLVSNKDTTSIRDQHKVLRVKISSFEEKAKEIQIYSISEFFESDVFRSNYKIHNDCIIKEL
mgnify:CR=1 FL=1